MLVVSSLVRNSAVLAVYLLFSVACFFTIHMSILARGVFLRCRARRSPGWLRPLCRCAVPPAASRKGAAAGGFPLSAR